MSGQKQLFTKYAGSRSNIDTGNQASPLSRKLFIFKRGNGLLVVYCFPAPERPNDGVIFDDILLGNTLGKVLRTVKNHRIVTNPFVRFPQIGNFTPVVFAISFVESISVINTGAKGFFSHVCHRANVTFDACSTCS
jgi:hypothetical protein